MKHCSSLLRDKGRPLQKQWSSGVLAWKVEQRKQTWMGEGSVSLPGGEMKPGIPSWKVKPWRSLLEGVAMESTQKGEACMEAFLEGKAWNPHIDGITTEYPPEG